MKIGDLASILNKDALELAKTYDLAEEADIEIDGLTKILTSEIDSISKMSLKKGKDDGYGMAERLVKSDVEKRIKSEINIDGQNLDELIGNIKEKISTPKKSDDAELQRERELRQKAENELTSFKDEVTMRYKIEHQKGIFIKEFDKKFQIGSSWLKSSAYDKFAAKYEIQEGADTPFAIDLKSNKPVTDCLEDLIFNEFKSDFENKQTKEFPKSKELEPEILTGSVESLFSQLRTERDPIRIAKIKDKIKELKN